MNTNISSWRNAVTTLELDIINHQEVLMRSGDLALTGAVAMVSDPDPALRDLGVMQVWSEAEDEMGKTWVHVTPDGVLIKCSTPVGE